MALRGRHIASVVAGDLGERGMRVGQGRVEGERAARGVGGTRKAADGPSSRYSPESAYALASPAYARPNAGSRSIAWRK